MATLTGVHKGRVCIVEVVAGGWKWEGKVYKSLSPIATAFCKCSMNGPKFFGQRKGAEATPRAARGTKTADRLSAPSQRRPRGVTKEPYWEEWLAKPIEGRGRGEVPVVRARRVWP